MFDVEIKNLKVFANIGITSDERKKKQLELHRFTQKLIHTYSYISIAFWSLK